MSLPVAGSIAVQRLGHAAAEPRSDDTGVAAHDIGEAGEPESGVRPAGRALAHAVEHLSNPWFTRSIVAPAGVQLGYHALMPLEGVLMLPVTLLLGPSASYNLLSILMPGLMCYAAYRVARLWVPT